MVIGIALGDRIERVEVPEEEILRFPKGVIGFDDLTHFALFVLDPPIHLLQSVEDPHAGFVVLDPFQLDPDYRVPAEEECRVLELDEGDRRMALCIVTLSPEGTPASVNMRAPLVLNSTKKLGTQVILPEDREIRHPLAVSPDGSLLLNPVSARANEAPIRRSATGARRP
jgi:flagellar assembly factor FliW